MGGFGIAVIRPRMLGTAALLWSVTAGPSAATGNLDCFIDDVNLSFELFSLTGGSGRIVQVNQGAVIIKAGGGPPAKLAIGHTDIDQQWIFGRELRLRIEIADGKGVGVGDLVLTGTHREDDDSYPSRYVLTLYKDGGNTTFEGAADCR